MLLRSHSSVYLSLKTSSSATSLLFFLTVWTVSTVTKDFGRASTVRAGSLNPRSHRTFWDLVPKQKPTACVSSSWSMRCQICDCIFWNSFYGGCGWLKKIAGLTLGTGWGLERENAAYFSVASSKCLIVFPSPNGWLQDSGKYPERSILTVSLTLIIHIKQWTLSEDFYLRPKHSLSKHLMMGVREPDHCVQLTK